MPGLAQAAEPILSGTFNSETAGTECIISSDEETVATKKRKGEDNRVFANSVPIPEILHTKLPSANRPCAGMKVLYLFAGKHRQSSLGSILKRLGADCCEVDILRSNLHDLSKDSQQEFYLERIRDQQFDVVVSSPPCDTFSRAKFANKLGPQPTRDSAHPRGLPDLPKPLFLRNKLGNILADFSYKACLAQLENNPGGSLIKEHPEDLGRVKFGPFAGSIPASIWQWEEHSQCISAGALPVGLRQCDFGTPYVKPTRLLIKVNSALPPSFFPGIPVFDKNSNYLGPIPATKGKSSLVRHKGEAGFRTTGTAAWPQGLCLTLSGLLQAAWARRNSNITLQQTTSLKTADASSLFPVHLPPEGFNPGGVGTCRQVTLLNSTWEFHDGLGLTSPGRFDKEARQFPNEMRWDILRKEIRDVIGHLSEADVLKGLISLSLGRGDLLLETWPEQIRIILHRWLQRQAGDYDKAETPKAADGQPFFLGIVAGILREGRDPDYEIFSTFAQGVTLGVLEPLPRTPALYEEQVTWKLDDSPFLVKHEQNPNYLSLYEHVHSVREQFEADLATGRMIKLSRAEYEKAYPPEARAISALAALQEKDKVRTLTDGTHHVFVNNRIRCRDKLRCPGPREKFFLLDLFRKRGNIAFSLLSDISSAHRLVKIRKEEWGLLACELDNPEERWLNTVGTFGFSSAAYWFSRLMSGILRLAYILLGKECTLDMLLYADDLEAIAETPMERRSLLLLVCILMAVGAPMKWSKFRGGFQVNWVGLHIDYRSFSLGLSAERAAWVLKWTNQCVDDRAIDVNDFQAGLGRINFACQALVFERPFLGILYAWISSVSRTGIKRATLPWAVAFVLKWVGTRIGHQRLMTAPRPPKGAAVDWFRADAKATDSQAFIGGWELPHSGLDTHSARWFALEIKKDDFGWAFAKGSPKRAIAALELLATLLCIKLFGDKDKGERPRHCTVTASTDNQGNSFIINKMMTTKYPSIIILLELTEELRLREMLLNLTWRNRDDNTEADALTNGDYSLFNHDLRIPIVASEIKWHILTDLDKEARALYAMLQESKDNSRIASKGKFATQMFSKKSSKDKLKQRDPW